MSSDAREPGAYLIVLQLSEGWEGRVGALGEVTLAPGAWLYVGSAMGGMEARVRRHLRGPSVRKWHIDWLTTEAPPDGAILIASTRRIECELATWLGQHGWSGGPRKFGSSDCRCATHLFGRPDRMEPEEVLDELPQRWRGHARVLRP